MGAFESGYERFVRTMPKKSAEQVLEDLDENGRERSEIERLIHRMMRDQPWLIWSGRMWGVRGWGGWEPDTATGFSPFEPLRPRMQHIDWDSNAREKSS